MVKKTKSKMKPKTPEKDKVFFWCHCQTCGSEFRSTGRICPNCKSIKVISKTL